MLPGRRTLCVAVLLAGVMGSGCASFGANKVVSSHMSYNDAVQLTITREVLSNIVRSRYADPIQFLAVSAINAQFSVSAGASAGVGGIGAGAAGDVGGSIGYSDSPTITYMPQTDAGFYKSLYAPFDVREAVGFGLAYRSARMDSGWNALSLAFSFGSISGVDDFVGGQYNPLYQRRVDAIVQLLQLGASYRQIPEWDFDTTAIEKDRLTTEDMLAAFRTGFFFIEEEGGENVRLARYRLVLALTLPDPDRPEVIAALEDLGVTPGRSQYVLRPPTHSTPGEYDPYAIWVVPRSMSDVLNLAARFVEIPADHAGIVPALAPLAADSWDVPSIRIRSSKDKPPYPYRIQHRGHWFYVHDAEIESKLFLDAMVVAYSSRVGSFQAGDAAPQVVIPVGGGRP
jgi:hypothetical protein